MAPSAAEQLGALDDQDALEAIRRFGQSGTVADADMRTAGDRVARADRLSAQEFRTVRVFYGTDRARSAGGEAREQHYANARGPGLTFGIAEVTLPLDHTVGRVERPWSFILRFDEEQRLHVVVQSAEPTSEADWVRRAVADAGDSREALLFVHGFNVDFDEAMRRTAQLAHDLRLHAMPLSFSWASEARLFGYWRDEETIAWSCDHLEQFLETVMVQLQLSRLHVVAHSMGNRAVLEVLRRLAAAGKKVQPVDQVVLAAPDVDTDNFRQKAACFVRFERVTMYASRRDWAIRSSRLLHRGNRASDADPPLVVDHMETIDVSAATDAVFDLGHGYIASATQVFQDLFEVISSRLPASERQGPRKATGGAYYVL